MRRTLVCLALLVVGSPLVNAERAGLAESRQVQVTPNYAARRIDVTVDGGPFTSYIWPESLTKPVLYPIVSATGETVTRGFPLDPHPGERTDHPHQVGLWLTYGNVNGIDFWNNSTALAPTERTKMGTIVHLGCVRYESGPGSATLEVLARWVMPDGTAVLKEDTVFVFQAQERTRLIDRVTKLTALSGRVLFKDDKEGVFGMRVARWLEQPESKSQTFTDASGKSTEVPKSNGALATGEYVTSEGAKGDAAWGTRGRWCLLHGGAGGQETSLAIIDHPGNPGFPTYWHARGYGLFAANPLGQKQLSGGKTELNFALEPGQTATFRYRVVIASGSLSPNQIEERYRQFANQ